MVRKGEWLNMNADILFFFEKHMDALSLYEVLENRIMEEIENLRIRFRLPILNGWKSMQLRSIVIM